jgi:hypothetical protein
MEKAARPFVKVTMDRAAVLGFPKVGAGAVETSLPQRLGQELHAALQRQAFA